MLNHTMPHAIRRVFSLTAVLLLAASAVQAEPFRSFHIGNSLTWDTRPNLFEDLSAANGIDHEAGHHIRSASSLPAIWSDDRTNVAPPRGIYRDALPDQRWDVLTLQPHPASTLGQDRQVIGDMVDLALQNPDNTGMRVVLVAPWAARENVHDSSVKMVDMWQRPLTEGASDDEPTRRSAAYYDALLPEVRSDLAAKGIHEVHLAPTGAVFFEVAQHLTGNPDDVPVDAVGDLFRDRIHASQDFGRYLAALTTWAVTHQADPRGLVEPDGFFDDPDTHAALTPEVRGELQQIVWDVISADPTLTGVSVPEPATAFGLLAGAGLLLTRRRTA